MTLAIDNTDPEGKVAIREFLLSRLGGAVNCNVLELFGGEGMIHDACYTTAKKHMAFDLRASKRPTWVQGDNRSLLKDRAKGWDLYDLDAYGNPWILANDICRLREDGEFALAITCGIWRGFIAGNVPKFVAQRVNLTSVVTKNRVPIHKFYPDIVKWLMLDWERWGVKVVDARYTRSLFSHQIHYYGVVLKKDSFLATEKP